MLDLLLLVYLLAFVALAFDAHAFLPSRSGGIWSAGLERIARTKGLFATDDGGDRNEEGLKIAVVGAGPSGLLLSHLLLNDGNKNGNQITLFDGRSDPRTNQLEGRAYALGLGVRGRTSIRTVDEALWEAVKSRGYESERFKLHLSLSEKKDLVIPLRSDSKTSKSSPSYVEPSLLIYQSELCASLLEELEERQDGTESVGIHFGTRVVDCDLGSMTIRTLPANGRNTTSDAASSEFGPFDLIVGCDGVNSQVRSSIDQNFEEFSTTRERLPGFLKVVRLGYAAGATNEDGSDVYDPTAVSLLIPSGAFIEPTGDDGSCCILFNGRGDNADSESIPVYLRETENITAVVEGLKTNFPKWKEEAFADIADQLVAQDLVSNSAYSVVCNTYHYRDQAVLVGDAAHATGGVSGQGVNSALVDAVVLAESLQPPAGHKRPLDLERSLLDYSTRQLPEGKALYDLSFGPKPKGLSKKLLWGLRNARDALFQGRLGVGEQTLQTRLSSELTSFAEIRREREYFYSNGDVDEEGKASFPSEDDFRMQLESMHKKK